MEVPAKVPELPTCEKGTMKSKEPTQRGQVQEVLRGDYYRVSISGQDVRCYIAGRMKINKIRVGVGDQVEVLICGDIGRIVRRY